ncbi:MAG: DUF4125 family protein [Erysipelotrichaceae bacterium]|nr:DUF4125 family protein [Erysipelotrichaceae bacterium]
MIDEIITLEWKFMQETKHIDGRAKCQDDYENFEKYRQAQFRVYNQEVLESYLYDLHQYENLGRNPITEKYGYMMASSDPTYYETIKDQLPIIDEDKLEIINAICQIEVTMKEEFNQQYPILASLSRMTHSYEDEIEETSFETYLRGELLTYSSQSLYLYGKMLVEMINHQQNIVTEIMQETVKLYGYQNIDEAQEKMKEENA